MDKQINIRILIFCTIMFEAEIPFGKKSRAPNAPRVSPERRNWVRKETAKILSKNLIEREKTKEEMFSTMKMREHIYAVDRNKRTDFWLKKTANSPFAVDLAAEAERINEENRIRLAEDNERRAILEGRKSKAKNDIVLRALSEFSDLEALRREKRAIIEEEQRLRALLALEKTTQNKKADRLAAMRAQKQRAEAKKDYRRQQYIDSLDQVLKEEEYNVKKRFDLLVDPKHPPFEIIPETSLRFKTQNTGF